MFFVVKLKASLIISVLLISVIVVPYPIVKTLAKEDEYNKTVYFTFDDGPSVVTIELLDLLKEYDVKATFFVIGATTERGHMLYKRIVDEGHTIGLHSYTHNLSQIYKSSSNYMNDLKKLDDLVFEITNVRSKICRFPGGSAVTNSSQKVKSEIAVKLKNEDYIYYDWNVSGNDDSKTPRGSSDIANRIKKSSAKVKGNDIVILLHDNTVRTTLVKAVEELILYFREKGCSFDKITEETKPIQFLKS